MCPIIRNRYSSGMYWYEFVKSTISAAAAGEGKIEKLIEWISA
jgi:hypothetical protein